MNAGTHIDPDATCVFEMTDSRNRLEDGHRTTRRFPLTWAGYAAAWRLTLAAEVRNPSDREDYAGYFTDMRRLYPHFEEHGPQPREIAEACETFNGFWNIYGWALHSVELTSYGPNYSDVPNVDLVDNETPAPEAFDPV